MKTSIPIQQSETISVDTLRRYWGDKDADKERKPVAGQQGK